MTLAWTDATPVVDPNNPANLGNPQNEIGFRIQRRNGTTGNWTTLATALANQTTYADTTAGTSTRYYRVVAFNAAGDSPSAAVQSLNGGCTPTLSSASASFTGAGGTGSVNVTVSTGCAWQAVSNALGWASITSGASGTGNGTVQY